MSNKSKQDQDIEGLLHSARAAMEAVGLPMEKFIPFQPKAEKPALLFSNPSKRKLSDLVPPSDTPISSSQKQKITL